MKKIILLLLLAPSFIWAQEEKSEIGLSIGRSTPIGNFGDQNINGGLAENGISFEGNYAVWFSESFSWIFAARLSSNSVNENPFLEEIRAGIPDNAIASGTIGNWATTSFLTGIQGKFTILEGSLEFQSRVMLGYSIVNSPSITATTVYNNETVITNQSRAKSSSIGFLFGGGLRFIAGEKTYLTANLNYFRTDADFDDIQVRQTSSQGWSRLQTGSEGQEVQILGLELGLVFKI